VEEVCCQAGWMLNRCPDVTSDGSGVGTGLARGAR
jgi:hypothetical protein